MNRQEAKGLRNHNEGYCAEQGCSQDIEVMMCVGTRFGIVHWITIAATVSRKHFAWSPTMRATLLVTFKV